MSDAAIATLAAAAVQITILIVGLLKLKYAGEHTQKKVDETQKKVDETQQKVDENTAITRDAATKTEAAQKKTEQAAQSARAAAAAATDARDAADEVKGKLNGGVDSAVNAALAPVRESLREHDAKITEIARYQHETKHAIADELHTLNLKVELLARAVGGAGAAGAANAEPPG